MVEIKYKQGQKAKLCLTFREGWNEFIPLRCVCLRDGFLNCSCQSRRLDTFYEFSMSNVQFVCLIMHNVAAANMHLESTLFLKIQDKSAKQKSLS